MRVEPLGRDVWIDLLNRVDTERVTPFQLPDWIDFELATLPRSRDCSAAFRFDDGAVAAVPIVSTRHRLGHCSYASVSHDQYGGVLSDRRLTADEVESVYRYLASHYRPIRVTLGPARSDDPGPPLDDRWKSDPATCHLLALPDSYDAWFDTMVSKNCRRDIRRAARSGLTVARSKEAVHVDAYYRLYRSSAARWGKAARELRPLSYFAAVLACPLSQLYMIYKDAVPAAGLITLESRSCTVYYLGSSDLAFSSLCPADLGVSEIIRDAIANRRTILNFGGSLGMPALEKFKEKFGAVKHSYATYYTQDFWSSTYRSYAYYRSRLSERMRMTARRSSAGRSRIESEDPRRSADGGDDER